MPLKYFAYLDGLADGLNNPTYEVKDILNEIIAEIKQESYSKECFGDTYSKEDKVVDLTDIIRIFEKYKEETK